MLSCLYLPFQIEDVWLCTLCISIFHIYCEGILCLKNLVEETVFLYLIIDPNYTALFPQGIIRSPWFKNGFD